MASTPENSPWICHICDYSSRDSEGIACGECYKITCRKHLTVATVLNKETGLYELKQICLACQLKKQL